MSNSVQIVKEEPVDEAMQKAIAEQEAIDNGEETDAPAPVDRPSWLPEKFSSPEDLAKAYSELEKKFSSTPKKTTIPNAPESSGLDMSVFAAEYEENGSLSEESVKKLVDSGIPEPIINTYLEGVKALGDAQTAAVHGLVGGSEAYEEMLTWASENLDEDEIDAFNGLIESGNMGTIKSAVKGLHARFSQTNGPKGRLVQGETSGNATGVFRSIAEVTAAMKDPRYAKDPAYRRDVENRLRNSDIMNVNSR